MVVFAIFAVCIVAVLLMGINTYKSLNERDQAAYSQRTCAHYLTTKVRQAADPDAIAVSENMLVLSETIEGEDYLTYIYCDRGWLREYFTSDAAPEDPDMGEKILPAQSLDLTLENNLLSMVITSDDGTETEVSLFLRKEAGHEK